MQYVISCNISRDLWFEVRKVNGRNSKISSNVDGSCGSNKSEKYKHLYNSVPYTCTIDDMQAMESTILERLHNCENVKYVISHNDVINEVSQFKKMLIRWVGGFISDHFLHYMLF